MEEDSVHGEYTEQSPHTEEAARYYIYNNDFSEKRLGLLTSNCTSGENYNATYALLHVKLFTGSTQNCLFHVCIGQKIKKEESDKTAANKNPSNEQLCGSLPSRPDVRIRGSEESSADTGLTEHGQLPQTLAAPSPPRPWGQTSAKHPLHMLHRSPFNQTHQ